MFYVYMYDLFAKSCGFKISAMNMTPEGCPSMAVAMAVIDGLPYTRRAGGCIMYGCQVGHYEQGSFVVDYDNSQEWRAARGLL